MKSKVKKRLTFIILLIFLFLWGRFFQMQVLRNNYYETLSERNRLRRETIHAPRGRIFDRGGMVLADSKPSYSVIVDPYRLEPRELHQLSVILGMSSDFLNKKIKPYYRTTHIRRVKFERVSRIVENKEDLPSVKVTTEPIRHYLFKNKFSHLLGYTGEVCWEELDDLRGNYSLGDITGKEGIERKFEQYLRGKNGYSFIEVDARGRVVQRFTERKIKPERGGNVHLTISGPLTLYTDSILSEYKCAAVVAMDPENGEILIYYSKPGYPSNELSAGIETETWDSLRNREDAPLWDRVIKGEYPPGSIFKIPISILALKKDLIDENTVFTPCRESLYIGDRYFRCWKRHGQLKLMNAIIQSCDVYFYQVGLSMSLKGMIEGVSSLGFGKKTGIDLPGEREGFLPSKDWYNKKYGRRGWDKGVLANMAIGQGEVLVTPLQLATFFSAIANDGITFRPHVLKKITNREGEVIKKPDMEKIQLDVDKEILTFIKKAMKGVVNNEKGTAYWTRLKDIKICGKTGTAQNPHGDDHALFVGFAPYDHPKIVAVAVIENTGHGSTYAAPAARDIINKYLGEMQEE